MVYVGVFGVFYLSSCGFYCINHGAGIVLMNQIVVITMKDPYGYIFATRDIQPRILLSKIATCLVSPPPQIGMAAAKSLGCRLIASKVPMPPIDSPII